ncbi:MAG: ABC transporter permease [Proteobacteria bacterium]|nr:ABC transporter permease [Pseudomonadota bacterium]
MSTNHAELTRFFDLLLTLTRRDIRVRYKQSVMGVLWAVLMPALVVGAGALVRVGAAQLSGTPVGMNDIESIIVRAVAWALFIGAIRFATNSLVGNANLVTKIAFPKEVFPLSAVLSSLFDFAVAAAVALVALPFLGWRPTFEALWALPLVLVLLAFTTGLSLVLSSANLFFRDVKYVVEILLTYAIFFTPVLYEARVLGKWAYIVMFNPVAPVLEGLAAVVVDHRAPDWMWVGYSAAVSVLLLVFGYWLFKQLEGRFAESI